MAISLYGERGLRTSQASTVQNPRRAWGGDIYINTGKDSVLREIGIVCNSWREQSERTLNQEGCQTLFGGHISQIVRGTCVEGVAFPIIPVLENNPQAIGSLH